jgi:Domain of unknown function (DUF397)
MTAPEPDGIVWHTSSGSGGTCVEVGCWCTSSYSADCVQVAPAPERVLVRDSKDPHSLALTVPAAAWRAFLTTATR